MEKIVGKRQPRTVTRRVFLSALFVVGPLLALGGCGASQSGATDSPEKQRERNASAEYYAKKNGDPGKGPRTRPR